MQQRRDGLVLVLAALGHRRIGMVLGMDGLSATVERVRGYRAPAMPAKATGTLLALAETPTAPVSGNNYMRSASCARSKHADCACRTTSRSWRCDPHFESAGLLQPQPIVRLERAVELLLSRLEQPSLPPAASA